MSIAAYAGEFTVSPIPLEMSMNYCSHKCAVCFANLNQPGRTLDVTGTINQIKNCHKSKSLTSYLLANKYPVLLSNRVDPFAKTNYRQTLSFIELFNANGNKIAFQTRGGNGIDDAISLLDYKSHWYISISQLDDNLRKKLEPGAPTIQSRFDLIEKLISQGHDVSVGINPLVEEWLPMNDFEKLAEKLIGLGVKKYWLEVLHLNSKQVGRMTDKERSAVGDNIISEAKKRKRNNNYFMFGLEVLLSAGMDVFSMNQPFKSDYFNGYKELKTIKTHQQFINYCFDKYPNGGEIKFHEYYDFMKEDFYEMEFSEADGYAYRIARNVYRRLITEPLRTLKQALEFYWENPEVHKSIGHNQLFSVLSYHEGKEIREWRCEENNMLIYWFSPNPQQDYRHFIE